MGRGPVPVTPLDRLGKILTELCSVIDELAKAPAPVTDVPAPSNRKKLTSWEANLIRSMHRSGKSVTQLARSFDVHHATISRIVRGIYHK